MRPRVRGLNLAGLLMQPGCAAVSLGFLAVHPSHLGISRGLGFPLCLTLVLQRPSRTFLRSLFAFERGIVQALLAHPRNIARTG
jgi:hypothetical protein